MVWAIPSTCRRIFILMEEIAKIQNNPHIIPGGISLAHGCQVWCYRCSLVRMLICFPLRW
jgi:hypothetical protein